MRKREFWESEEGLQLAELWARDGEDDRAIARRMRVPERTLLRWKRAGGPLGEGAPSRPQRRVGGGERAAAQGHRL